MDKANISIIIYLDLSKTFYILDHNILLRPNINCSTAGSDFRICTQVYDNGPYINAITSVNNYFNTIIYADCVKKYHPWWNKKPRYYKLMLKHITNWLKVNKLSLNTNKSQSTLFYIGGRKYSFCFWINIDNTSLLEFLASAYKRTPPWETHINKIKSKISSTLGIINRFKHYVPPHILHTINSRLILPHLRYYILFWGYTMQKITTLK